MVSEAKLYWRKRIGDIDNPYLEYFKSIFRKNPGYIGPFFNLFINRLLFLDTQGGVSIAMVITQLLKFSENNLKSKLDIDSDINSIKRSYDLLLKYKQLFSNIDFSNFENLEELEDYLNNTIIYNDRKKFVKKFISSKYHHLINDDTYILFDNLRKVIGEEHSKFNDIILTKIASFNNPVEYNNFLKLQLNLFGDWNVTCLEKKAIDAGANIIYKDSSVLIVETPTYSSMKMLGSQNWCIVRSSNYFNYYKEDGDKNSVNIQYIIFDTSREQTDISSMVGVTIDPYGKVKAAHLLNDTKADVIDYMRYFKYLKPVNDETLRKIFQTDVRWVYLYDRIDELKRMYVNKIEIRYEYKPLYIAIVYLQINVLKFLLEHVYNKEEDWRYAISLAKERGYTKTVTDISDDIYVKKQLNIERFNTDKF